MADKSLGRQGWTYQSEPSKLNQHKNVPMYEKMAINRCGMTRMIKVATAQRNQKISINDFCDKANQKE